MLDSLSSKVEEEHSKYIAEIRAKDQTISSVQQRLAQLEQGSAQVSELQSQLDQSQKVRRLYCHFSHLIELLR